MLNSVELFSGAGGLALGMSLAGIKHHALIERNNWACKTIEKNKESHFPLVTDWPIIQSDIRDFKFSDMNEEIDIVAGGPPCQPFSMGGNHRGSNDPRDMFPATAGVIRTLKPKAFIIENVKGLTRASFANYLQYIVLQLTFPEITNVKNQNWVDHLSQLEKVATSGIRTGLSYDVVFRVLNAADFGIPQKRERIFIVGFRHDLDINWSFPNASHSLDSLLRDQWITGEYWSRNKILTSQRPMMPANLERRIEKLSRENATKNPWRTVRDALLGLPEPDIASSGAEFLNHNFQPGAKTYKGHTGSPIDLPSKTLKAGDHGVPGGENMMVRSDGSVRYFTVRESARLQTFPDSYEIQGSWSEAMRQLGNAVPVELARQVAASVAESLLNWKCDQVLDFRARKNAA